MIGNGLQLGVQLPVEALLFIIAVPWPDLSCEAKPGASQQKPGLKLLTSKSDTIRAWPGGFGDAKVGANYGPALRTHGEALGKGCDQILWLLGDDGHVTEAGASNFFVVWRNKKCGKLELVTSPLDDKIILDGVTRRSVLDLARGRLHERDGLDDLEPLNVVERNFTMHGVARAWEEGRLVEAFVSGTAVSTKRGFGSVNN